MMEDAIEKWKSEKIEGDYNYTSQQKYNDYNDPFFQDQ